MKAVKFSAIFYLALSSIQVFGMEDKEAPAGSPGTSLAIVNFDSAATSPIPSTTNSPIMQKNTADFTNESNPQQKKRDYDAASSSNDISWTELDSQMAQNYEQLKHIFAKKSQEKSVSSKSKKKISFKDYHDSSSDDDSDVERMLNN